MNAPTPKPEKPPKAKAQEILKDFWKMLTDPAPTNRINFPTSLNPQAIPILQAHPWILHERVPKSLKNRGDMPFLQAVLSLEQMELTAYGIAHGAPLEDRCPEGNTALAAVFIARGKSMGGNFEEFKELINAMLSAGAKCESVNYMEKPIWLHAKDQPIDVWKLLLERGSPVDCFVTSGMDPLSGVASLAGMGILDDKVMLLANSGADLNLVDRKKIRLAPLMQALGIGNETLADALLGAGADIHLKDGFQRGFLHLSNQEPAVKWLIKNGVDLEGKDTFGRTPLLLAVQSVVNKDANNLSFNMSHGSEQSAMLMVLAGADLDARDHQDTSLSARELIDLHQKIMPQLSVMLRSIEARQVAMQSLAEMGLNTPSP